MDMQTEFINRYLKKQTDLVQELLTLKLQSEVKLEISELANAELQAENEALKTQVENLKHEIELYTRPDSENTF